MGLGDLKGLVEFCVSSRVSLWTPSNPGLPGYALPVGYGATLSAACLGGNGDETVLMYLLCYLDEKSLRKDLREAT